MARIRTRSVFPLLMTALAGVAAADVTEGTALRFDQAQPALPEPSFVNPQALKPEKGDFRIEHYAPMSNDLGERWALITLRNGSDGARLLKNEHLVATFADGTTAYAGNLNQRVEGGGLYTQAVFFGASRFPIVRIEVR